MDHIVTWGFENDKDTCTCICGWKASNPVRYKEDTTMKTFTIDSNITRLTAHSEQ